MRRLSAHYIFDGEQYYKLATLVVDEQSGMVSLEQNTAPYKEQACVEFYNGVICYNPHKKSNIVLLEDFDFEQFRKTKSTKEKILVSFNS